MKLHPRLSRAAVELVTRFESFHPLAQPAAGGGWTIGYGHTRSAREGARVSREDAEALLLYDLAHAAETVEASLFAPVTQRQFEALCAFCFNIGADNFRRSSALARINAGADLEAADEIERWRRAELGAGAQVVDALVRRRAAEKAHFLGLPEGWSKSPRAVLRPLPDADGTGRDEAPEAAALTGSATRHAADSVQARLRELVPEPAEEAELEPPPFEADPMPLAPASTTDATTTPTPDLAPDEAAPAPPPPAPAPPAPDAPAPDASALTTPEPVALHPALPEPAPYVAPPPPHPPVPLHDLAANDASPALAVAHDPPPVPPPPPPAGRRWAATSVAPAGRRAAFGGVARFALGARGRSLLLAALGAFLLVAALVVMLGVRPSLANLAVAVLGVLLLVPGIYGLLGPSASAEERPPAD